MARVKAPAHLAALVTKAFASCKADGSLHYFPTQAALLTVGSLPFQLRFSPSLANKPKSQGSKRDVDPFAYPPGPLFVADLGPSHFLVLNKFAVVPEHFILATREFKQQTHVLEAPDLEATLACIEAYSGGLFAFFNSGQHSGASQPHRHIQLLPIARMREGLEGDWSVLADRGDLETAPFAVFSEPIRLGMPAGDLHGAYLRLYRRACRAAGVDAAETGEAPISYNLAMTQDTLALCPRVCEGGSLEKGGEEVGRLALNGTLLAGTALVKTEKEWDALRSDPGMLQDVLTRIGVSKDTKL